MVASWYEQARQRAEQYCESTGRSIERELGGGQDGLVLMTHQLSAIKAFRYAEQYARELKVYIRLQELKIQQIAGFTIPRLRQHDPTNWLIEMSIVSPPFVVDFVAAYVDEQPPFDRKIQRQALRKQRAAFGDKWPQVQRVLTGFAAHGIFLTDINPGNIMFASE